MNIELIRLKFNSTYSYKYKPFEYCCKKLKYNKSIAFEVNDFNETYLNEEDYDSDADNIAFPRFCTSTTKLVDDWGATWYETTNYPISMCPHCGEPINIKLSASVDLSEKYEMLEKQRSELWKKCLKTDSKKKETELRKQVDDLDRKIQGFYIFGEWTENPEKEVEE